MYLIAKESGKKWIFQVPTDLTVFILILFDKANKLFYTNNAYNITLWMTTSKCTDSELQTLSHSKCNEQH